MSWHIDFPATYFLFSVQEKSLRLHIPQLNENTNLLIGYYASTIISNNYKIFLKLKNLKKKRKRKKIQTKNYDAKGRAIARVSVALDKGTQI